MCGKCGRWNLTPIEERWEAIEECERQYRGVITRSSTDNIGLGRVKEGTDLIRIGAPLRPEFAAWRYGRFFQRRRRLQYAADAVGWGATIGIWGFTGAMTSAGALGVPLIFRLFTRNTELGRARRFIVGRAEKGFGRKIWKNESVGIRLISTQDEQGWGIRFALDAKFLDFHGAEALHTAHLVAPAMNVQGANASAIDTAVQQIERAGSPDLFMKRIVAYGYNRGWKYTGINEYPEEMRLAFEMAAHEETERTAIEGELAQLETDWREAEEIAAIADNLFLPKGITDFIARHKPAAREKH